MANHFKAPAGTYDFLPDDHDFFTFVKKVVRHRFRQSGFRRISPPLFEETETFEKSLGISSEIIKRELYSFEDRHGRSLSLRPEVTTGIVRSFIENDMNAEALPKEFYYIDRCYRFERPKQNTRREFWQIGAEIIGETDAALDAQIIYLGHQILEDLGIRDKCDLRINTIGSEEDRTKYFEALANFYADKEKLLSPTTQERLNQKRYLDVLEPQNEDEEVLVKMAPKIIDFLSPESQEFFDEMIMYLNSFGIEYTIDPTLIRPNEYYAHTTFEFTETLENKKLLVGGRYDGLSKRLGGPDVGGVGFSCGVERTITTMKNCGIDVPHKDYLQIFVAATGPVAKKHALPILIKLRKHGFHAVGVLGKTSMVEQLERAERFNVPYTLLMGDIEVKKQEIIIRNMKTGKSETIPVDSILDHMDTLLCKKEQRKLDTTTDFLGHE